MTQNPRGTAPPSTSILIGLSCLVAVSATILVAGLFDLIPAYSAESALALMVAGSALIIWRAVRVAENAMRSALENDIQQAEDTVAKLSELNQELESARQEAESANNLKTRILSNINHELRTPLNAIIGFSDILANQKFGALGSDTYVDYAQTINTCGTHMNDLVTSLMEAPRAEAGKISLTEEYVPVEDILKASVQLSQRSADERGVRIDTSFDADLPRLYCDEHLIRQSLVNVLSNAIKFSTPPSHVTVLAALEHDEITICVTDSGSGISADQIQRITDMFVQGDSGFDRKFEGSGIGLSIAKRNIELHQGQLDIESKEDVGTSVTFIFPRSRVERPDDDDQTIIETGPQDSAKMTSCLVVSHEGQSWRVLTDGGKFIIGRNRDGPNAVRCDLHIDDRRLSRPHAIIKFAGGGFKLIDQSKRGTHVRFENGQEVTCTTEVPVELQGSGIVFLGTGPDDPSPIAIQFQNISLGEMAA